MIKNKKSKKIVVILSAIAAIIFAGAVWWFFIRPESGANSTQPDLNEEAINYSPPTETEKSEADTHKDEIVSKQNQPKPNNNAEKSTPITVTTAALNGKNVEVRGYISGIVQENGTCTYSFTGNGTIIKTSVGVADVSTTNCGVSVPRTSLPGTGWKVVISYKSGATTASSSAQSIDGL